MRTLLAVVGVVLALIVGGLVGYQWAAHHYSEMNSARNVRLRREFGLMLTVVVDIAEHKTKGETELAEWKFAALRDGLEGYLRGGGPDPTWFVPRIVEVTEVPANGAASVDSKE